MNEAICFLNKNTEIQTVVYWMNKPSEYRTIVEILNNIYILMILQLLESLIRNSEMKL